MNNPCVSNVISDQLLFPFSTSIIATTIYGFVFSILDIMNFMGATDSITVKLEGARIQTHFLTNNKSKPGRDFRL